MDSQIMALILPFFALLLGQVTSANYLVEQPVKLLNVESLAVRYKAAESKFRVSIDNGEDQLAERTEGEILNDFPDHKMLLRPGGCASYNLPIKDDQVWGFVQPARKQGSVYEDYCNKAKLTVNAKIGSEETQFTCFEDPTSCSSKACLGDLSAIVHENDGTAYQMSLHVCNDPGSATNASIWEINLSTSNDSNKIMAVFADGAKERLRETQNVPEFDTQLTIVAFVGDRGVGKSTLSSLLAGNETMFQTGSSSTGTTTVGADLSPPIPTKEYSDTLSAKLKVDDIYKPTETLPIFLIDSEGMNVRGDAFDFVTTSPPAVVAKVIIWVGSEKLVTAEILEDVGKYLDGLDNIIFTENDGKTSDDGLCDKPKYGHFVIVINKMMGPATDEQLYSELMTEEPDLVEGYEKRNAIRHKLTSCFAGLSVHGFPVVQPEQGQDHVTYGALTKPFRAGLSKIANTVLESSLEPKTVSVGSFSMVLNSTNAEVVLATVIKEANRGRLDLNGFEPFWTYVTSQVEIELDKASKEMTLSVSNCQNSNQGLKCTSCVCLYRNGVVDATYNSMKGIVGSAREEATLLFNVDASEDVADVMNDVLEPWVKKHQCVEEVTTASDPSPKGICDFSVLPFSPSIKCRSAFICKANKIPHQRSITVSTQDIYIHEGSTLDLLAPARAANGLNGDTFGKHGGDGSLGTKGTSFLIHANSTLSNSVKSITVFARGGGGGNGGNGFVGADGPNGPDGTNGKSGANGQAGAPGADVTAVPSNLDPKDANAVVSLGAQVGDRQQTDCHHHCVCGVVTCTYYYHYQIQRSDKSTGSVGGNGGNGLDGAPGTNGGNGKNGGAGGNGGQGGKGGDSGDVQLFGLSEVTLSVQRIGGLGGKGGAGALGGHGGAGGHGGKGGTGGHAGAGGPGGYGRSQSKTFKAYKMEVEKYKCGHFGHHCGHDGSNWSQGGYQQVFAAPVKCCQGQPGNPGTEGKGGNNGSNGKPGVSGAKGSAGKDGAPGNS